ncbi:MAG: hypothetical protein C4519_19525 [Desulfobacteraceae bacterium]|nr:MAG: hypothetical protein C4519_19525 [Desulfobacteraceae bacterium]
MDIWLGYSGLAVAFVVLGAVLVWVMIQTPGRYLIKAALTPPIIWYGVVLYFAVQNLMGWPATHKIPESSLLLAVRVNEPNPAQNSPGAIYLWVNEASDTTDAPQSNGIPLDPRMVFKFQNLNDPRAYKVPYSREMHEAIVKAQMQAQATPGALMKVRRNGKPVDSREERNQNREPITMEVINPKDLLPKKGAETRPEIRNPYP